MLVVIATLESSIHQMPVIQETCRPPSLVFSLRLPDLLDFCTLRRCDFPISLINTPSEMSQYIVLCCFLLPLAVPSIVSAQPDWRPVNDGLYTAWVSGLQFDRDGRLFASTRGGPYRSTDHGATWAQTNLIGSPSITSFVIDSSNHLYVTTYDGIHHSSDHGESWRQTFTVDRTRWDSFLPRLLAVSRSGDLLGKGREGIYRSSDRGRSWDTLRAGLPNPVAVIAGLVAPGGEIFITTGRNGVLRSTDNGASWEQLHRGLPTGAPVVYHSIVAGPDGRLFLADAYVVYVSTDNGESWRQSDNVSTYGLFVDPAGRAYSFVGNPQVVLIPPQKFTLRRSTDGGATWTTISDRRFHAIASRGDGELIASVAGNVLHSSDGGATWQESSTGLANFGVDALTTAPDGSAYLARHARIFRTTDHGETWLMMSDTLGERVNVLISTRTGHLLAGTSGTEAGRDGRIWRSTDHGASWRLMRDSLTGEVMTFVGSV